MPQTTTERAHCAGDMLGPRVDTSVTDQHAMVSQSAYYSFRLTALLIRAPMFAA